MTSSIEWLIEKMQNNIHHTIKIPSEYVEQAKLLHKQEIKKSYEDGKNLIQYKDEWGERYYNETFVSISDISKMVELPQQEISDEEIEDASLNIEHYNLDMIVIERIMWRKGAKWYREQLKTK